MTDSAFRRKLVWLITARAAAVTVLLGSAILIRVKSADSLAIDPFFFLIGLTYALTLVYSLLLRQAEQRRWLVDLQLACDAVIVSIIVYLTGGVLSYFSSLFTLPVIAASTVRSGRSGLMVGILSSVLYAGIVTAEYLLVPGAPSSAIPAFRVALYTLGLNVFGFMAVAVLSGYLAEGLRRADAELRQASSRLADLQAFSQHVIDSLLSGLATTNTAGQVMTFNRAAEAITGVAAAEAVGQPIASVLQLPLEATTLFGSVDRQSKLPRVEFTFNRRDGRRIELGLSTAILRTPRGETGYLFTFQDVTEARKQEREARVRQRLAAVGEMAAGIAHEIRNPLASMSGSIQILRQELPLTEDQAQLMDIVLRESERLNDTIRNFLAYARPQRQAATRIDLRQLVTDTATLLQNSPERHETHELAIQAPAEPVWCLADEAQIRQIVWNLATNGLRAMPDGGTLTMSVAAEQEASAGQVVLTVRDEGVGIPPAELDGILQPFRGGFARGSGLGLSIVHRIVSDYGGELQVTSQQGEGTAVVVKLPMATPQTPNSQLPTPNTQLPTSDAQLDGQLGVGNWTLEGDVVAGL